MRVAALLFRFFFTIYNDFCRSQTRPAIVNLRQKMPTENIDKLADAAVRASAGSPNVPRSTKRAPATAPAAAGEEESSRGKRRKESEEGSDQVLHTHITFVKTHVEKKEALKAKIVELEEKLKALKKMEAIGVKL